MKILDDILSTLNFDAPVRDIRQGIFHTAVLTRYGGLAATLPRDALQPESGPVREPGFLLERPAKDLVRMAYSDSILEAAIGMATINSLLEVDVTACRELNAAELILEKGVGKNVAVIGHFPFLPRIRDRVKALWVIEKHPREGDFRENEADRLVPQADVVAITGTALTNHTLPHLLELCAPSAFVLMLGDTVPLSPILFDHGLDALSGSRVEESRPDLALALAKGPISANQGIRKWTMVKT